MTTTIPQRSTGLLFLSNWAVCIVTEGKAMGHKRNPVARVLRTNPLFRTRREKSRLAQVRKADRWSRAAKHKLGKPSGRDADAEDRYVVLGRSA